METQGNWEIFHMNHTDFKQKIHSKLFLLDHPVFNSYLSSSLISSFLPPILFKQTVVSSKDEFQTKEDEIAEWIEQMMFGGTSGEEFVDCSNEDHFSSKNQLSIELQTYESNKSESLLGESEGSVSFSFLFQNSLEIL